MAPSKAAAVSAAVLEAPGRSARAGVVVPELLDQLLLAAVHAARASLHLRFGAITRAPLAHRLKRSAPRRVTSCSSFSPPSGRPGFEVRMEGVEPSWPFDRRLLRPVRIPVPPHPHGSKRNGEPQAHTAERAARRSRGRPRRRPLRSCALETRLPANLELDDLGGARHRLGPCRDPYEVQVHLASPLCLGRRRAAPSAVRGRRGRSRR
jgi:hypothetical protein